MSRHRAPRLAKRLLAGGLTAAVATIAAASVIASGIPVGDGTLPDRARPTVTFEQAALVAPNVQAATVRGWGRPVAAEDFSGTAVDKTRWSVYNSAGHHGAGLRRPSQVTVSGGAVTLRGDSAGTTGGMSAKFGERKYGRWEVRMKTSTRVPGYHPVLILWPQDGYLRGKCDGEVDFSESTRDTRLTHFYLHHSCANQQTQVAVTNDTTAWHNYAVEWTPKGIFGYLDGKQWFRDVNPAHLPPRPMHATIQLDWFPKDGPAKPASMSVDWVRVYDTGPGVQTPSVAPTTTAPRPAPAATATATAPPSSPAALATAIGGQTVPPFVTASAPPAAATATQAPPVAVTPTTAPTTATAAPTAPRTVAPTVAPTRAPTPTTTATATPTASPTPTPTDTEREQRRRCVRHGGRWWDHRCHWHHHDDDDQGALPPIPLPTLTVGLP